MNQWPAEDKAMTAIELSRQPVNCKYGIRMLLWMQCAVAPLFLGLSQTPWPSRPMSMWEAVPILYLFPAAYGVAFSLFSVARSESARSIAVRRVLWGSLFGALYALLLIAPPVLYDVWQTFAYRPHDRWAMRNLHVEVIMATTYLVLSAIISGFAAGIWTLMVHWMYRIAGRRSPA